MRISFISISLLSLFSLIACQSGEAINAVSSVNTQTKMIDDNNAALSPDITPSIEPTQVTVSASQYGSLKLEDNPNYRKHEGGGYIAQNGDIIIVDPLTPKPQPPQPRTRKTYLINGLMSAVPFIGFGFRNLHKKMPEAQIYSYLSPVESVAIIMPKVMKDIEAAYAKDPNVAINLIGISLGADFVSIVAEKLHRKNIPVNYLGIVDGTSLRPIQANVKKVDNLTCTFLDCVRGRVRLAKGNSQTIFTKKKYKSSHIPLGNNEQLHTRVIAQSRS